MPRYHVFLSSGLLTDICCIWFVTWMPEPTQDTVYASSWEDGDRAWAGRGGRMFVRENLKNSTSSELPILLPGQFAEESHE